MSLSNENKKINLDNKAFLQSKNIQYLQKQNFQSSLPPPLPSLQFRRQKIEIRKISVEQEIENKRYSYNTKDNIEKYMDNVIIQYLSIIIIVDE
jgi:hypothetical protein